jgi:hypothetical protein
MVYIQYTIPKYNSKEYYNKNRELNITNHIAMMETNLFVQPAINSEHSQTCSIYANNYSYIHASLGTKV